MEPQPDDSCSLLECVSEADSGSELRVKLIRPLNQIGSILSGHGKAPARGLRPKDVVIRFVAGWALLLAVPHPVSAFPKAQGYVNDFAGILNSRVSADLEFELRAVERQTSAEIVLVTVPPWRG